MRSKRGETDGWEARRLKPRATGWKPAFAGYIFTRRGRGYITVDAEKCGGRPCIRGMRIRVTDVLDLLASGLSRAEVLQELPDLEPDDVEACLRFASRRIDHPILAA